MSDSSSSEEENVCLREAVDPTFFSNELFKQRTSKKEGTVKPVKLPPSKRNQHQQTSSFNLLEIRATPEFRAYVSKHLHRILDNVIDDSEELKVNEKEKFTRKSKGVKLLRTSRYFLSEFPENQEEQKRRKEKTKKRRRVDDESSSDEEKRAREVAVTADWILSGKATEGWAPCTKGELEVVTIKSSKK